MTKHALISVSDKTGIVPFAKVIQKYGYEIISTGGTAKSLKEAGIKTKDISEITEFPEMMDGRVKTLHPKIHGGLLAVRENKEHMSIAKKHAIEMIDLVIVNLYPFEATIQKKGVSLEEAIENIDIGGPSMLRSAAKNHHSVAVVTDPKDYNHIIEEMEKHDGAITQETKKALAVKVFSMTAHYDSLIYHYLNNQYKPGEVFQSQKMPEKITFSYSKAQDLRYGENPHQIAAYYGHPYKQLHGKELSFNNIIDMDAAWAITSDFSEPAVAIVKHTNPCGAAIGKDLSEAYSKALASDPVSAFGGIVSLNKPVDAKTAKKISETFYEIVVAPSFEKEALSILEEKKNLRLIERQFWGEGFDVKRTDAGLLVQTRDEYVENEKDFKVVTKTKPQHMTELVFAMKICRHVKSNAIVLTKDGATIGVGAGQMSRIDSLQNAAKKAGEKAKGAVLASDAFFPFKDNVDLAAQIGIKEIIQPGGSVRDQESIDACNEYGISMVFTGIRHFKH